MTTVAQEDADESKALDPAAGFKRQNESALENPVAKRPKVIGWGQGLVRKKAPEKKAPVPDSSMVTAVLIAALSSSGAVSPPSKLQAAMRAVRSNDVMAAASPKQLSPKLKAKAQGERAPSEDPTSAADEVKSAAKSDPADVGKPEGADVEAGQKSGDAESVSAQAANPATAMSKEELLLTIETTDSEIAKLEARLAELLEEEEAEAAGNSENSRQLVLPDPSNYSVDFVDLRGQQAHSVYLQNQKTHVMAKRKQLLARLMPASVLEQVAAGKVLYNSPVDLPSYHENVEKHKKMRLPLIEILMHQKESVKRRCNKLTREWHMLNAKYESKQRSRAVSSRGNSKSNRGSQQRINNSRIARSPRDTGVVRSDAEMHQIISQLEEEERYQRRFEFNLAKIPEMIINPKQKEASVFISKNSLIEDPVYEMRLFSIADVWSEQDSKLFLEKYMTCPKNFRKIATAVPYKTTQDCIRFYYRYKKELDLKTKLKAHQLKKRPGKKGQHTVLERTPHKLEPPQILGKHEREGETGDQSGGANGQQSAKKSKSESWTEQDRNRFIRHIKAIGKDWKKLARAMGSSFSVAEVQAYYELNLDSIETILDEEKKHKKEAEAKQKVKKEQQAERRRQAQQAMQQANTQAQTVAAQPMPEVVAKPPASNAGLDSLLAAVIEEQHTETAAKNKAQLPQVEVPSPGTPLARWKPEGSTPKFVAILVDQKDEATQPAQVPVPMRGGNPTAPRPTAATEAQQESCAPATATIQGEATVLAKEEAVAPAVLKEEAKMIEEAAPAKDVSGVAEEEAPVSTVKTDTRELLEEATNTAKEVNIVQEGAPDKGEEPKLASHVKDEPKVEEAVGVSAEVKHEMWSGAGKEQPRAITPSQSDDVVVTLSEKSNEESEDVGMSIADDL